jgi:hypothetical protein
MLLLYEEEQLIRPVDSIYIEIVQGRQQALDMELARHRCGLSDTT